STGSATASLRGSSPKRPSTATGSRARSTPTIQQLRFHTSVSGSCSSRPRFRRSGVRLLGGALCVLALVAAGCSSGGQSQAPTITGRSGEQAAWQPIANGLDSPLGISSTPSEPNRLYIVEQPGLVRVLDGGKLLEQPFLDIR